MKHTYKFIFLALFAISNHATSAELEFTDVHYTNSEKAEEPRLQLKLFPGIAKAPKKSSAMHMADPSSNKDNVLNLNSSLVRPPETFKSRKYSDDIEVTSNNLLELRF